MQCVWHDAIICAAVQCVAVCCSVLQCVAVCCSVLQCVAVCCSVLQCVAVCCGVLHHVVLCCIVLQCVAVCCSVVHYGALCCIVLQYIKAGCSVLRFMGEARPLLLRLSLCLYTNKKIRHIMKYFGYINRAVRVTWRTNMCGVPACCSVVQCVAVCCSVLQCVALYLRYISYVLVVLFWYDECILQHVAACCSMLHCVALCCTVLELYTDTYVYDWKKEKIVMRMIYTLYICICIYMCSSSCSLICLWCSLICLFCSLICLFCWYVFVVRVMYDWRIQCQP